MCGSGDKKCSFFGQFDVLSFLERRCSGAFIVKFEHISHFVLVFVSIVNFEQVNAGWIVTHLCI